MPGTTGPARRSSLSPPGQIESWALTAAMVPSGVMSIRTSRAQPEGSMAEGASRLGMDGTPRARSSEVGSL